MAPSLKLIYFDVPGRAEPMRLALFIGGVEFVDQRITSEEMGALKEDGTLPFNQVPVLEVDGEVIAQTLGILHYCGRLGGVYPQDALIALRCDEAVLTLDDIISKVYPAMFEKDEAKKAEMVKKLTDETLPFWLGRLEARLVSHGKEYAVDDNITIADLYMYNFAKFITGGLLSGIPSTTLDGYPKLKGIFTKISEHPRVKEWNEAH